MRNNIPLFVARMKDVGNALYNGVNWKMVKTVLCNYISGDGNCKGLIIISMCWFELH